MIYDKSNKEILAELDSKVHGHTQAKKALISLVNRSKVRHLQKWGQLLPKDELIKTSKCLLIGGSGTGKTHLVQTLANIVNFPLLMLDATSFNPTGASGGIKPETLRKMIVNRASEYTQADGSTYFSLEGVIDQMVVFVDEFDKISNHYEGSSGSWNEHLQTNFLTLFENYDDLDGVSWVFAGAFSGMDSSETKSYTKRSIGFLNNDVEVVKENVIDDEQIVKYGLLPEIVGRLTSICRLDKLTEDDYYDILVELVLPKKITELLHLGIDDFDIGIDEPLLRDIAQKATKSSQGVRYLYRELDKHFLDREFNYEDFQ